MFWMCALLSFVLCLWSCKFVDRLIVLLVVCLFVDCMLSVY